jgi:hypothetical protein
MLKLISYLTDNTHRTHYTDRSANAGWGMIAVYSGSFKTYKQTEAFIWFSGMLRGVG